MQICQLDAAGLWTGETLDIDEHDPVRRGWVAVAPPAGLPEGDTARYTLTGWMPVAASDAAAARDLTNTVRIPTTDIDAERDRRIDAGFAFAGKLYQARPEDRENIAGAATAALAAIMAGALPTDLRWHGGDDDFYWIAADNSTTAMDAQTVFALGQMALAHKRNHITAGRALKNASPIPADYRDDAYWPALPP